MIANISCFSIGNCLFRAFSDQLYGDQSHSSEIRAKVVEYERTHEEDFKSFVDVQAGNGIRRNPKRKNAAPSASSSDAFGPTPDEIDEAWKNRLRRMAMDATFGDSLEIRAFAAEFKVDVRVYCMPKSAYFIHCGESLAEGEERQVIHIALNVSLFCPATLRFFNADNHIE